MASAPPDTDAALGPWHSTGAECSVVIYYSFAIREAKPELQTKKTPALVSGVRTERHLWLRLRLRALCPWQIYLLSPLFYILLSRSGLLIVSVVKINEITQVKALGTVLADC